MSTLPVYDQDTVSKDELILSLADGAKKYSDWQAHENGAEIFARLTLIIAMREFLCVEKEMQREALTSVNEISNEYNSVSKWDNWDMERRNSYILRNLCSLCFRYTIGSDLREFAVRHHACGLTTAAMISLVFDAPQAAGLTPLRYYINYLSTMRQPCRDYLSTQLNYLKVGQPRFPKKYLDLWQTARAEHIQHIQHIPLTHISEQIAAMQQHYQKLLDAFDALPPDPEYTRERERLTNAMTKTLSGIHLMTRDPSRRASGQPHPAIPETSPASLQKPVEEVIDLPATSTEVVSS